MALGTLKVIEEAVYFLLATPPVIAGDVNREEARGLYVLHEVPVYLGWKPQGSADICITFRRDAGPIHTAITPTLSTQTAIEINIWGRNNDNQDYLPTMYEIGQLLRVYLVGMQRTIQGVDISDCQIDGAEAIQSELKPIDDSDNWAARLSWTYLFTHDQSVASKVAV